MKRRDFLAAASSCLLPLTINGFDIQCPAFWQSMSGASAAYDDRVLVLIYLNGGNDGLNTVIPLNQLAAYNDLRTNIAIPENRILRLTGNTTTGLHPAMTGLLDLSNDGKLSIVHSVGYPDPSQSHARSAAIWMTARRIACGASAPSSRTTSTCIAILPTASFWTSSSSTRGLPAIASSMSSTAAR